jgi:hypothetical protein
MALVWGGAACYRVGDDFSAIGLIA